MVLTFKYRLYPTQAQATRLCQHLSHLCELHNAARLNRIRAYEEEGRSVRYAEQCRLLTQARARHEDFRVVPHEFQKHALQRVNKAFANFFRRVKQTGTKPGFPRYRKRIRSLTWSLRKNKAGIRQNPIRETKYRLDRLLVPKLGDIKIRMTRPLQGDPKEVSIVRKASGWYAHISCDIGQSPKVEPTHAIAVDVGTNHYLTTSEGEKVENPRWYRKAEGLLKRHSKTQSRRKKGSHRWQKAVQATALHQERTTNKRKDFIGKLVYKLYHHKQNNVIVAEALNTSNMVKNKHLSKSISDAAWATFFDTCANIAERDGLHFHQVDPKHTSQTCSSCGQKSNKKLSLATRTFKCSYCANTMDRDHNAAQNILQRAAAALRGERWATDLYEARNKNEATKATDHKKVIQLSLFDTLNNPNAFRLG